MPILYTDLLSPSGDIETSYFPDKSSGELESILNAYISEGYAKSSPTNDAAAIAWAYYKAFRAIYVRMSITPARTELNDQGSEAYLKEQIAAFGKIADGYKNDFDKAIAEEETPVVTSSVSHGTVRARNIFTW